MEFTPNSCSSQCPGASIYRMGAKMSIRQNIPRHRPDGGHGPSGRTTVRTNFPKFPRRNLSYLRTSSGQDGTSFRRSHIRYKYFPYKALERPDHGGLASGRLFFNT
jgi:hypothetical protein